MAVNRQRALGVIVASLLATPGCFWFTTKHEGETLRKDVDEVEGKVAKQEDALGDKLQKLQSVLEEATKLLTRNSADLGNEVNQLVQENAKLTGLVMEAKRYADDIRKESRARDKNFDERLLELEQRLAALEKASARPKQTPEGLYAEAKAALDAKQYSAAHDLFKRLVVKHPRHNLADDAQYYRGEARYRQRDYKLAIGEFQKVYEKYPRSSMADDALFRAGESAHKLKWCTDARAYFGLLRQKFPKSELARKAQAKDRELKRAASNKRKCKQ